MLEDGQKEIADMVMRAQRIGEALGDTTEIDDVAAAIDQVQAKIPTMSQTEDPAPMFKTPAEAKAAAEDSSQIRLKSLEDNCTKFVEEGR